MPHTRKIHRLQLTAQKGRRWVYKKVSRFLSKNVHEQLGVASRQVPPGYKLCGKTLGQFIFRKLLPEHVRGARAVLVLAGETPWTNRLDRAPY